MPRRIAIIQGHPDPRGNRYGHALAAEYAEGAKAAGHEVRLMDVAALDFPPDLALARLDRELRVLAPRKSA